MSLLYQKHASRPLTLDNRVEPELYRDVFPYTHVSRIEFDDTFLVPRPADPMFITDTTFRDGQQARPPYTVKQIARIYDLLHKLGGKSGLIQASEFFMYSPKDRKAIEVCRSRGYRFPASPAGSAPTWTTSRSPMIWSSMKWACSPACPTTTSS